MANKKNFRLKQASDEVKLGKSLPKIKRSTTKVSALLPDESDFAIVRTADPVGSDDLINKSWAEANIGSLGAGYTSNSGSSDTQTLPSTIPVGDTYVYDKSSPYQIIRDLRIAPASGHKIFFKGDIVVYPGYIKVKDPSKGFAITGVDSTTWVLMSDGFTKESFSLVGKNSWTAKAVIPSARTAMGTFSLNGYIYMAGGIVTTPPTIQYNDVTNAWASKANLPTTSGSARSIPPTFTLNGYGYVTSGADNINLNSQYTDSTDTWTAKAVGNIAYVSNGATLNGYGYKIAGADGLGATNYPIHQYNDASNAWTNKVSFATGGTQVSANTLNGYIYAVNGFTSVALNTNWQFNDMANTLVAKAVVPQSRYGASCFIVGGYMYSACGNTNPGLSVLNYEYSDFTNAWTSRTSANTGKSYNQGVNLNGYGYSQAGGTDANEQYS